MTPAILEATMALMISKFTLDNYTAREQVFIRYVYTYTIEILRDFGRSGNPQSVKFPRISKLERPNYNLRTLAI